MSAIKFRIYCVQIQALEIKHQVVIQGAALYCIYDVLISRLGATNSGSADGSKEFYEVETDSTEAERRLVQKLDWFLLPWFTLILFRLEKDLGMVGFDYDITLTVLYVFHIFCDIPSNLALKHFGSMWLAAMVTCFSIISISTVFVKSYSGLIVTRVFLRMAEGGTVSGLTYIVSRYYQRKELVTRIRIFFGASVPLAGALGRLLASGLLHVRYIGTVKSWCKIFLVEGIITTGIIIPADLQHTHMLTAEEKTLTLAYIDADQVVQTHSQKEPTTFRLILRSFNINASYPSTIVCLLCYLLANISFQGLILFMPTVIATLCDAEKVLAVIESQLRTVLPYLVGAVWAVVTCYHNGGESCYALTGGTDNAAPDTIRVVTSAIIPGFSALGAVIAVWTYLPVDALNYHKGNSLNLGTTSTICLLTIISTIYIRWENGKHRKSEQDCQLEEETAKELADMGYLHPCFHYQL
ncbi:MFS general substrate transporter [Mycena maculata]|uniref:MFS general substrate transporter n=1 Tax=Mycena maculata TaxID=230809 RepID=A0AAD7KAV7_9AGAR|nr:MFS general substrate transporter [Mycena maculata]